MVDDGPVLNQINLVVADTAASADFYGRLGVSVPVLGDVDVDHVELPMSGRGDLTFELDSQGSARLWNASWRNGSGAPVVLGFALASREAVDETYADLAAAGHAGVQPPFDAFWGSRYAIVADPDGNQVGLMSPRDLTRAAWPPADPPDP